MPDAKTLPADLASSLPSDATIEHDVELATLKRHPRNPRKGNREKIRKSIEKHGFADVVIAQVSTRYIIAGWHRQDVARELGYTHAPLVIWRDVDDDEALRQVLDYNKASDDAEYDLHALRDALGLLEATTAGLEDTLYTSDDYLDLRRITGELGAGAASFLDDVPAPDVDAAAAAARAAADQRDSALSLTFALTTTQRETVLRAINKAKSERNIEHSGEAITWLCEQYL